MSVDQPGKVTKLARGQLNRKNEMPLLQSNVNFLYGYMMCTFMDVCCCPNDMTIRHVPTKQSISHVFILYEYMYVAPQDESSCRFV